MTNPEIGPITESQYERQKGIEVVSRLSVALDSAAEAIEDKHHQYPFSNADRHIAEDVLADAYDTIAAAKGYPIQGKSRTHMYIVAPAGEDEPAIIPRLKYHQHAKYDFEGVVETYARPLTDIEYEGEKVRPLCLVLRPLYTLFDPSLTGDNPTMAQIDQLRHPFADTKFQDQLVYIPIKMIVEGSIKLLNRWKDS